MNRERNYEPTQSTETMIEIARFPGFKDGNGNVTVPKTRNEKLTHLINILESVEMIPASKFHMPTWVEEDEDSELVEFATNRTVGGDMAKCGFAGCALGWASIDPTFNDAGLNLGGRDEDEPAIFHVEWGKEILAFDAGEYFFEISESESYFLFDPDTYYEDYYDVTRWLDEPEDIQYHEDDKDLDWIGYWRELGKDRSMTFPSYEVEENDSDTITPRMVINRIKHIMDNPFPV